MKAGQMEIVKGQDVMAESCGSAAFAESQRQLLQQHGFIADAGSFVSVEQNSAKAPANTNHPNIPSAQRSPLQEANRDISAHPVQVSQTQGALLCGQWLARCLSFSYTDVDFVSRKQCCWFEDFSISAAVHCCVQGKALAADASS